MVQVSVCWKPGKDRETMTTGIMMSSNDTDIHAIGITDNIKTFNFLVILGFTPLSILQV
jgi:phage terminase large subunit-like protein